jgi:hypothetical protein
VIRRSAVWARQAGLPAEAVRDVFWQLIGLSRRSEADA